MSTTYRQKSLDETINPAWRDELLRSIARWAYGAELPLGLSVTVELVEYGYVKPAPMARVQLSKLIGDPEGQPERIEQYRRLIGREELA